MCALAHAGTTLRVGDIIVGDREGGTVWHLDQDTYDLTPLPFEHAFGPDHNWVQDVAVNADGKILVLTRGGSGGADSVWILDPATDAFGRLIAVDSDVVAISVDAEGFIYALREKVGVVRYNPNGTLPRLFGPMPGARPMHNLDVDWDTRRIFVAGTDDSVVYEFYHNGRAATVHKRLDFQPNGIVAEPRSANGVEGAVYVASAGSQRVDRIDPGGVFNTVVLNPQIDNRVKFPLGLAFDLEGRLLDVEPGNGGDGILLRIKVGERDVEELPIRGLMHNPTSVASVRAVATPQDDHGNDTASATAMAADGSMAGGNIETSGDVDVFSFPAQSDYAYTITAGATGSALDVDLRLLQSDANVLASSDISAASPESIEWTTAAAGELYVAVTGSASGATTGAYDVVVSGSPVTEPDDHGDDPASATPIAAKGPSVGEFETSGDVDVFSFDAVGAGSEYTIIAGGTDAYVDIVLRLIDGKGRELAQSDIYATLAEEITWTAPSAGTYYVEVTEYVGDTGGYEVSVSGGPPVASVPPVPVLRSVNGITATRATLRWQASDGATSYEVQADTATPIPAAPAFKQAGITGLTADLPDLDAETQYGWRVRAVNDAGPSAWSAEGSFTTRAEPLDPPVLRSAADVGTTTATLRWRASDRATSYRIHVDTDSAFAQPRTHTESGVTGLTLDVEGLEPGTTYYWRARAMKDGALSDWSDVRTFDTSDTVALDPPELRAAAGLTRDGATLRWRASAGATSYNIEVGSTSNVADSRVQEEPRVEGLAVHIGDLAEGTTYHWRAQAVSDDGESDWSNSRPFTTAKEDPEGPLVTVVLDSGGTTVAASLPFTAWVRVERVAGLQSFAIQVEYDSEAFELVDARTVARDERAIVELGTRTEVDGVVAFIGGFRPGVFSEPLSFLRMDFRVTGQNGGTFTLGDVSGEDFMLGPGNVNIEPDRRPLTVTVGTPAIPGDITGDGVVNLKDFNVLVENWGLSPLRNPNADITGTGGERDGVVNLKDFNVLLGNWGKSVDDPPAAGSAVAGSSSWQEALRRMEADIASTAGGSPIAERALAFIDSLRGAVAPQRTAMLPNYPNPFNPETWIPFELSKRSDVSFTIYDDRGRPIRALRLGNLPTGSYTTRGRAAYWDGHNELGERVASGVYFAELRTSGYRAMRRLVVRK